MFESIYGHERKKEQLEKIIKNGKYANTYLFSGPPNVGKFSLAMEFSIYILGQRFEQDIRNFVFPDFVIIYPILKKSFKVQSSYIEQLREHLSIKIQKNEELFNNTVNGSIPIDIIRELIVFANKKPYISEKKIIIVKNAETMRKESANSFLKLLEEPPENTIIILTTDNINNILPTIISRCQLIKFGYLSDNALKEYFNDIYNINITNEQLEYLSGTLSERDVIIESFNILSEQELISIMKNKEYELLLNKIKKKSLEQKKYFVKYTIKTLIKILTKELQNRNKNTEYIFQMLEILYEIENDLKRNFIPDEILYYILTNIQME